MDREKVISEFERWCDEKEDECPVICLDALDLLKEQQQRIEILESLRRIEREGR